jgi:hypothetical protein
MPKTAASERYRIAYLDIETAPNLGYVWQMYEQNVIAFEHEWYILSFSVKWEGSPKVETYCLPDYKGYYSVNPDDDFMLVKELHRVLDEADLVVWHNGDKFDKRKINARFIYHGMSPPSPYGSYDTLKQARKVAAFNSNKLNDLAQHFGLGKKAKHNGVETWLGCLKGDPVAWKTMARYNAKDVVLLEKVYKRLRPWGPHPDVTYKQVTKKPKCPACGSTKVEKRGWRPALTYRSRSYHCLSCGKYSQGEREKIPGAQRLR